ncbi:FUSC family protein [Paraclostridium bifermentans]|uniref:FUSC family protein n=3 Tax=Paraclostridium bifermentans TaxID=1490 RepID=UPI00115B7F53|nr:FUSC family protein [Paraclostridium bifermentans]TQO56611.1 FUSC family protein [Paraclostridium bifermentans]
MDKKNLIQSFLKAVFLLLIQIFYMKVFGRNNMLIGLMLGIAAVVFLKRDFTGNLLYRTITFLTINLLLGIVAYLSNLNIYTGFVLNFIAIFATTYAYMNDFRQPTSYIFLMTYIFMWSVQITSSELQMRLLSITFGVLLIIFFQVLFNMKKFKIKSDEMIKSIIKDINYQIDNLIKGNYDESISINTNQKIRNLIIFINERSHKKLKNTKYELDKFNLGICLFRLNLIINHVYKSNINKSNQDEYLLDLKEQLKNLEMFNERLIDVNTISLTIEEFLKKYDKKRLKEKYIDESIYILKTFTERINNLPISDSKILNKLYTIVNVPTSFSLFENMIENFNLKSLRFKYSLRVSVALSISMFLVSLIGGLRHSAWIILSTYVILQPYQEDSLVKAKQRFLGVTIGAFIFFLVFSIVRDYVPISIILLISFTGYFYFREYKKKVIMTTIMSLSSISLVQNIESTSFNRFVFVSIGICIGLVFNKYFLPYNINDSINELKHKYKKITKEILKEIESITKGSGNLDKVVKLSMQKNQIENKLILNSNKLNENNIEKFIYEQSIKMNDEKYLIVKKFNE